MIHYTCDRCRRVLDPAEALRYVVKMEVYAVMDAVDDENAPEDDRDHLLEVHEILERADDDINLNLDDKIYQKKHYDLCPQCHRKFLKNPIAKERAPQFGFSQN